MNRLIVTHFYVQALLRVFSSRKAEISLKGTGQRVNSHDLQWQIDRLAGFRGPAVIAVTLAFDRSAVAPVNRACGCCGQSCD